MAYREGVHEERRLREEHLAHNLSTFVWKSNNELVKRMEAIIADQDKELKKKDERLEAMETAVSKVTSELETERRINTQLVSQIKALNERVRTLERQLKRFIGTDELKGLE